MTHGIETIKRLNQEYSDYYEALEHMVTDPPFHRLDAIEREMLENIRKHGHWLGANRMSPEKEREIDEYLKRNPVSIRIQPRKPRQ
jgi:hypothetical protein